ncbi:MAG: alpha-L-arabinofuranosidase C-terminal domain-containing protein [Planctomycetota bacterium]|nr:alpha-L-arabinofuranosidase C-terminal domain-containing protein [Planctomycetota bacterium]
MTRVLTILIATFLALGPVTASSAQTRITVQTDRPGAAIRPTMWGVFFEDINFGADGGLYAELVKNRSFEFPDNIMGWSRILQSGSEGYIYVEKYPEKQTNAHFLRMKVGKTGRGFGISNGGFRGMGIREGKDYRFRVRARVTERGPIALRIELAGGGRRPLAEAKLDGFSTQWQEYTAVLRAGRTEENARLNLFVEGSGTLDLDMVSLFPVDTWKDREGGLRADLVQMLAEMKPGFLRFPGGCIVEGRTLDVRYQWKTTIGDPADRKLIVNRWNTEFNHRLTPDYYQSFGLGFYEYFLLSEDLGAEPMPIINCGMACQFNTGELAPMDELGPYVQDALDLIEFANGPADSGWGRKRAEMGHPEPFGLKLLGIGNEQWGPQYIERYKVFVKAIQDKYPDIQLIAGTGSDATIFPNGQQEIDYLWSQYRRLKADIVDEHFYRRPDWFLDNAHFYDNYERDGSEIFVGEYGAQSIGVASPDNRNNWHTALAEAAFMTGLERNADLVTMSCYAPLFCHVDGWQWRPDLIWFDNLRVFGTPNYYVQKLFSLNRGDRVLPVVVTDAATAPNGKPRFYASSAYDDNSNEMILKVVNATGEPVRAIIQTRGAKTVGLQANVTVLASDDLNDENSFEAPRKIAPVESRVPVRSAEFRYDFRPYSMTIVRLMCQSQ